MRRFELYAFDLDGTLADTRHAIAWALNETLVALGREPLSLPTVIQFVGDGASTLITRALGETNPGSPPSAQEVERARALFIEIYSSDPLRETVLYEGVVETLAALAPLPRYVLTNKPSALARQLVAGLGLEASFDEVLGPEDMPARKPDPRALADLCARHGVLPSRAILVGDSAADVQTARAAGSASAGVLFGFRPDHFEAHPPDWELERFQDLLLIP